MSADTLVSRLDLVRRTGQARWSARCPAHSDKSPSLSIREEDDGRVLVHCHAGCDTASVLSAVGLDWDALFPPNPYEHARPLKKPWRVSDVVRALEFELEVASLILGDVGKRREISAVDRVRAGEAADRIAYFLKELRNAG